MRALAISAVVGAMVLSGCSTTGNNLGGVEYDKTAIGALVGAAARLFCALLFALPLEIP